jgi:hypothetical protein
MIETPSRRRAGSSEPVHESSGVPQPRAFNREQRSRPGSRCQMLARRPSGRRWRDERIGDHERPLIGSVVRDRRSVRHAAAHARREHRRCPPDTLPHSPSPCDWPFLDRPMPRPHERIADSFHRLFRPRPCTATHVISEADHSTRRAKADQELVANFRPGAGRHPAPTVSSEAFGNDLAMPVGNRYSLRIVVLLFVRRELIEPRRRKGRLRHVQSITSCRHCSSLRAQTRTPRSGACKSRRSNTMMRLKWGERWVVGQFRKNLA